MDTLKVILTVKNESTCQTDLLLLPDQNFNKTYSDLTNNRTTTVTVVHAEANFEFVSNNSLNIQGLNNLLEKVNALSDSRKERVLDLYQIEDHSHLGLLIAYTNERHYEVVDRESADCTDWNELKRRAGAIYMLAVCPDLLIIGDNLGLLSNEYRDAMFREGIRSGGIHLIGDKLYIKDKYLLETATGEDIDYYDLEEHLYEKEHQ